MIVTFLATDRSLMLLFSFKYCMCIEIRMGGCIPGCVCKDFNKSLFKYSTFILLFPCKSISLYFYYLWDIIVFNPLLYIRYTLCIPHLFTTFSLSPHAGDFFWYNASYFVTLYLTTVLYWQWNLKIYKFCTYLEQING